MKIGTRSSLPHEWRRSQVYGSTRRPVQDSSFSTRPGPIPSVFSPLGAGRLLTSETANKREPFKGFPFLSGAEGETRTPTARRPPGPQPGASTCSATPARFSTRKSLYERSHQASTSTLFQCQRTGKMSPFKGTGKMSPPCVTILNMKKNAGDLKMSLKQARKLVVLERLCEGMMSNREAASYLDLSVRQTQRAKS
ncbi:MAG: hypothetical protein PWR02_1549 [Synergistales bacterium]|nr:hypothetical protein [Synergistales bacterium]